MEKGPSSTVTGFTTCTQHKRVILHRSLISIFNKRNESRADKALTYSCLSIATSVLQFVLIFKLDINDIVYKDFHAYKPLLLLTQFKKKCSTFFFVLQRNIPWYFLWPWLYFHDSAFNSFSKDFSRYFPKINIVEANEIVKELLTLIFLMTLTSLVPYFGIILKILLFTLCTVKLIHSTTLSNFLTLTFLHPWFCYSASCVYISFR